MGDRSFFFEALLVAVSLDLEEGGVLMKSGGIAFLLAAVAVLACIALDHHLGVAEPDSPEGLSPLLPTSKNVLFSLGVAEAREAVKKIERKVLQTPEAESTQRCEKPEPLAEVAAEIDKEFAAQKTEQENLFTVSQRIREKEREVDRLFGRQDELTKIIAEQNKKLSSATKGQPSEGATAGAPPGSSPSPRGPGVASGPGEADLGKPATEETRALKEEGELNRKELDKIPDQILSAQKQIEEGRQQLRAELSRTDEAGLTWRARALIVENQELIGLLRTMGGAEGPGGGALRTELVKASAAGRTHAVKAMLESGADVACDPGEYSALAYAKVFGFREIGHMLERTGAVVQVPWDPNRKNRPSEAIRTIENQIARLRAFSATLGGSGADVGRTAYDLMLLDWIACRFDACKSALQSKPRVASDKP